MSGHVFGPGEHETRDGRKAVVLHRCGHNAADPLIGYIRQTSGVETVASWSDDGRWRCSTAGSTADLLPPPPPRRDVWGHYYGAFACISREEAHKAHARYGLPSKGLLRLTLEGAPGSERVIAVDVVPDDA